METTEFSIAGVTITHPDKILYPDVAIRKRDVAEYYEFIALHILPELLHRPVSLVRTPDGVNEQRFFQKHPSESFPKYIERVSIEEKNQKGVYVTLDALNDLIYLANLAVLEFHTWQASLPDLESPDKVIFDLDPDPKAPWEYVIEGAHLLRTALQSLDIEPFIKTSGIKGLHLVIPLTKGHTWDQVKDVTRAIADLVAEAQPKKFTTSLPKSDRVGKVFIDYLRNTRGATNVAAYSLRTYKIASVSTPIFWEEVTPSLTPFQFTIKNIQERIKSKKDPWKDYMKMKFTLPKKI